MNKSPIAVFLTDTHLSEHNTEVVKCIFRQAIGETVALGLDRIFHLGDIFHSRKGQIVSNLNAFLAILNEIEGANLSLAVIPGNHDKQDYEAWESFLDVFSHHPATFISTQGDLFQLTNDIFLLLVPFFEDEQYLAVLKSNLEEHNNKCKGKLVLGTHIGIAGATMNNGTSVESSVTPSAFSSFDLVLTGHYHDQQELAGGKIKYIGASLQHNFGEKPNKGLTVLYNDLSTELIQLDFPQYTTLEVNVNDITLKDIADLKEEKQNTGDFIRVVLTGKESDIKSFNRQELSNAGIKVEIKEDKIDKQSLESRIEPFNATSLAHEFETFCTKNDLDMQMGKKYFNKVIG